MRPDPSVLLDICAGMKGSNTKAKTVPIIVEGNEAEGPAEGDDEEEHVKGPVLKALKG